MRRLTLFLLCGMSAWSNLSFAQSEPLIWKYTILTEVENSETEVEILFTGKLAKGWKLYGTGFKAKDKVAKPLDFRFSENGSFALIRYPLPDHQLSDELSDITWFENKVEFRAWIKILEPTADICGKINGRLFNDQGATLDFENKFQFY